jgi:hypothetical protein
LPVDRCRRSTSAAVCTGRLPTSSRRLRERRRVRGRRFPLGGCRTRPQRPVRTAGQAFSWRHSPERKGERAAPGNVQSKHRIQHRSRRKAPLSNPPRPATTRSRMMRSSALGCPRASRESEPGEWGENMDADERAAVEAELNRRWAGQELLEEVRQAEMRAIIQQHIDAGLAPPRTRLAREIGLSIHRLRVFSKARTCIRTNGTRWRRGARTSRFRVCRRIQWRSGC